MAWVRSAEEANKELAMGIEVEKEHLGTIKWLIKELGGDSESQKLIEETAKRIAQDHIKELPDYYTRLKEMESGK